jgi:hypothetical protein
MRHSPILLLLAVVQIIAAVVLGFFALKWRRQTGDMLALGPETQQLSLQIQAARQPLTALLTDSVTFSEKNPALRTVLQQAGVRITATNSPATNPRR